MQQKSFQTGELVKVNGKCGKFRYVTKNIVRSIKSGRCYGVKIEQIKKPKISENVLFKAILFGLIVVLPIALTLLLLLHFKH